MWTMLYTLRDQKRFPNVCFVSPRLAKLWRLAKASTGGSYLFPLGQPMMLDDIPIVELDGLPTAGPHLMVGDFSQIVMIQRLMCNGLLAKVDRAFLGVGGHAAAAIAVA